jgi:predicted RNA-binding Zn-ribbon protein involved in translation (DUF1610 family)
MYTPVKCPNDGYKYVSSETGFYCPYCGEIFYQKMNKSNLEVKE